MNKPGGWEEGTPKFAASGSEVWVFWELWSLWLGFEEGCLAGDHALNLRSVLELQNCVVRTALQSERIFQAPVGGNKAAHHGGHRALNLGSHKPSSDIDFSRLTSFPSQSPSCCSLPLSYIARECSFPQTSSNFLWGTHFAKHHWEPRYTHKAHTQEASL